MDLSVCVTDDDYEGWRAVRIAVVPGERCDTVAELRAQDSPDRLMLLALLDGVVVGSGMAARSDSTGSGFAAPRVLPEYRRRGVGTAVLRALAEHVSALGLPELRGMVEDPGSLEFATHFGFGEVDRQVEQLRAVGDEPPPPARCRPASRSSPWTDSRSCGQPPTRSSAGRSWPTSPSTSPSRSAPSSGAPGPATRCSSPCTTAR